MSVGDLMDRDEDRPAYVRFEKRAVQDKEASLKEGHYVSRDENWILVTPPYSKDCFEEKVDTFFAKKEMDVKTNRIPSRHLEMWKRSYESWEKGQEMPVDGTPIRDWNALSPAQCENIIRAGCKTIEDLAQINDEGLRRLGMGGQDLKVKAKSWLQAGKDHTPLINEVSGLRKENDQLKGSLEALQAQVSKLLAHKEGTVTRPVDVPEIPGGVEVSLQDQYEAKFGKKPHHRMKEDTILAKLKE